MFPHHPAKDRGAAPVGGVREEAAEGGELLTADRRNLPISDGHHFPEPELQAGLPETKIGAHLGLRPGGAARHALLPHRPDCLDAQDGEQ